MNDRRPGHVISFIIPVLNGAKYIAGCIDHIIAEMNDADELIVVDNGSTDATLDIVRRYPTAKILVSPGTTIAASRNLGAEEAVGDLFAFIDSDVNICKGWREAVESLLEDDTIDATGSRYEIPEQPHWIEKAWYSKKSKEATRINYINSGNLIVRRAAFEAVGGFDGKLITDEDCDLGERLNQTGHVVVDAPQICAIHMGNPKSLSGFYRKEKWHATSSLSSLARGRLDKPTAMTIGFLICCLLAILSVPLAVDGATSPLVFPILILLVPVVTALYRGYQFSAYRYIPSLALLYIVFYLVRSLVVLRFLYDRTLGRFLTRRQPS